MSKVFTDGDAILKNIGTLVAYFLIFRQASKLGELTKLPRKRFAEFETRREQNALTLLKTSPRRITNF